MVERQISRHVNEVTIHDTARRYCGTAVLCVGKAGEERETTGCGVHYTAMCVEVRWHVQYLPTYPYPTLLFAGCWMNASL